MKQAFASILKATGTQDFKWYHHIIVLNWVIAFVIITGEPDSMIHYLWTIPYFGVSTWALTKCPVRDDEDMDE